MFDSIVTQVILMACSHSEEDFSKKVQCLHHKAKLEL